MKALRSLSILTLVAAAAGGSAIAQGPFAPMAGVTGSTAIAKDDPAITGWATGYDAKTFRRGYYSAANPELGSVEFGEPEDALGPADVEINGFQTFSVVSLGDGGAITLTFDKPITDGPGYDFAVFENSFSDSFLELAFVEVSSDGESFLRFPAISLTPTETLTENPQRDDFSLLDPTYLYNLAGKYRGEQGTPFDLAELPKDPTVNTLRITHVRIIDVVGSINPALGSFDSEGRIIKDPFPTRFDSGGFDLDAIGVLNQVPEPGAGLSLCVAGALLGLRRRRVLAEAR